MGVACGPREVDSKVRGPEEYLAEAVDLLIRASETSVSPDARTAEGIESA